MNYYSIIICCSVIILNTSISKQVTAHTWALLPEIAIREILRNLSTKQILEFRLVNKQVQIIAEKVFFNEKRPASIKLEDFTEIPPISLIEKIKYIILLIGSEYNVQPLLNNVSHIKKLELVLAYYIQQNKQGPLQALFTQLKDIEYFKIKHTSEEHEYLEDIVRMIPQYAHLKKLYLTTDVPILGNTLLNLLSNTPTLQKLHLQSASPQNVELFTAFTKHLSDLVNLKKLCLYIATLNQQQTAALIDALRTLKKLNYLNLRKTTVTQEGKILLENYFAHVPTIKYIKPITSDSEKAEFIDDWVVSKPHCVPYANT